jgi:hypothetical protein
MSVLPLCGTLTISDAKKLERVKQKIIAICQKRLLTHDLVICEEFIKFLKLNHLHGARANFYLHVSVLISLY